MQNYDATEAEGTTQLEPSPENRPEIDHSRRRLLETGAWTAAGVVGIALLGTGSRFVTGNALAEETAQWVTAGELAQLPAGQMHKVAYTIRRKDAWRTLDEKGLFYVFSADGATYTVLSGVCTHLGCNVQWRTDNGDFRCPCHDAHFDQTGAVVSGPPRKALVRFESKVEDGKLLVLV